MAARKETFSNVEAEAKERFGEGASNWLHRPSRLLDGLTPHELAQTPEGAWVVLRELRRNPGPINRGPTPRGPGERRTRRAA